MVGLAPGHQPITGEAAIGTQHNPRVRPSRADLGDNTLDLLHGPCRCVEVGATQLGHQQMTPAEHVERQVAVAIIVAVEEPALLMAVQRVVGGVEVQDDLLGRLRVGVKEQVDEQAFELGRAGRELVVAGGFGAAEFEAVQRGLAGQRGAAAVPPGGELAGEGCHDWIVAELVVVVEVFVAERYADDALQDQGLDLVLDEQWIARVAEAGRHAPGQPDRTIRCTEQDRASIGGDAPTIERGHHGPAFDRCKLEQGWATVRQHRDHPLRRSKALLQKNFRLFRGPVHLTLVRNAG